MSHTRNNPYICALCGEEFISRNHINRRTKIHTLENFKHCHLCGKVLIPGNHLESNANQLNPSCPGEGQICPSLVFFCAVTFVLQSQS